MGKFVLKTPNAPATDKQLYKLKQLGADVEKTQWTMQRANDEIDKRLNGPPQTPQQPQPKLPMTPNPQPNKPLSAPQLLPNLPSSARDLIEQARADVAAKERKKRTEIFASVALKASVDFYNGKDRPPIEVDATARHFMELLLELSA